MMDQRGFVSDDNFENKLHYDSGLRSYISLGGRRVRMQGA